MNYAGPSHPMPSPKPPDVPFKQSICDGIGWDYQTGDDASKSSFGSVHRCHRNPQPVEFRHKKLQVAVASSRVESDYFLAIELVAESIQQTPDRIRRPLASAGELRSTGEPSGPMAVVLLGDDMDKHSHRAPILQYVQLIDPRDSSIVPVA